MKSMAEVKFFVWMPRDLHKMLIDSARRRMTSASAIVREALLEYFERRGYDELKTVSGLDR